MILAYDVLNGIISLHNENPLRKQGKLCFIHPGIKDDRINQAIDTFKNKHPEVDIQIINGLRSSHSPAQ